MRIHTCTGAPSPKRVTAFLAEKGMDIERVEVDLRSGEHLSDAFQAMSPDCTVPVLELNSGECLWNTVAIRQYLEEIQPEPALLGHDALERARVTQWTGWLEHNGFLAAAEAFRNNAVGMQERALPGRRPIAQIRALAERGTKRFGFYLEDLDRRLAESAHVAGPEFSVADLDAFIVLEFGLRATRLSIDPYEQLSGWYQRIGERPSLAG